MRESERVSENKRNREDRKGWNGDRERQTDRQTDTHTHTQRERERDMALGKRQRESERASVLVCIRGCHGNRASKQACAFFNSNALPGKRWGYNEVPAFPSCSPPTRLLAHSLARYLPRRCVTHAVVVSHRAPRQPRQPNIYHWRVDGDRSCGWKYYYIYPLLMQIFFRRLQWGLFDDYFDLFSMNVDHIHHSLFMLKGINSWLKLAILFAINFTFLEKSNWNKLHDQLW